MIATINGTVSELLTNAVVMEVGGLGYEIRLTSEDLGKLKTGKKTKLYVHEHLREDAHELYGFSEPGSRELFEQLISVSGVGPKMAMAVLSAASAERVRSAIASGQTEILQAVSGVGKRTAGRIVVELRSKVIAEAKGLDKVGVDDAAYEALRKLGYSTQQAKEAVASIPTKLAGDEERIKYALKELGS
ncbi:Holliday junction branch migration protein RuvA [Candidatus Microgenomates bacterium]|nr:Holliday junction branch migration protein RuvA [Candidatus Microgenomates bacterium]